MRTGVACLTALVAISLGVVPATVHAEDETEYVPGEQPAKSDDEVEGWNGKLALGANVNLSSNQDVVGETDGFTALLGLSTNGALEYNSGAHQWESNLLLNESFARTPSLGEFVKNTDTLALESLYQYYFLPWSGAFGEATFETSLFTTNNVTAEPRDYVVARTDGTEERFNQIGTFELAGPLDPTSVSESAGIFVKPVRKTPFTLVIRGGIGARETLAQGVRAVDDNPDTDVIEVTELRDVYQAGAEAFAGAQGEFPERDITYKIGGTGLLPLLNNDPQDRGAVELFRYGLTGQVNFNVFEWMSINYNARILRDPQLIEKTQVQNNLLLTVKYSLIEAREPEGEKPPTTEEKLKMMQQRAEEAEGRVEELEKRVDELEGDENGGDDADGEDDTTEDSE